MNYFCTYFDRNYLSRGLALHRSLREHCPESSLWVLCLDDETHEVLLRSKLAGVTPISLDEFECDDEPLQHAKQDRSQVEYYFTCTPSLPLFILNNWPDVDRITYLDADLFFFSDPAPLFDEIGDRSIAIIAHRFPPRLRYLDVYGKHNVGWLTFRRDEQGLRCLQVWRNQCLEWCYDRVEGPRYGDQKYLDNWPQLYTNVALLQHAGANLAPWNVDNYRIHRRQGRMWIDDQPLIFYHFQGLVQLRPWLFRLNFARYQARASAIVRRQIYGPYVLMLNQLGQEETMRSTDRLSVGTVRYASQAQSGPQLTYGGRLASALRRLRSLRRRLALGEYVWLSRGRLF